MIPKKDDWEKPRATSQHLTAAEIATIKAAFDAGRKPSDIARELKCSSRVANKYFAQFRGHPVYGHPGRPRAKKIVPNRPPPPSPPPSRFYKSNFEL